MGDHRKVETQAKPTRQSEGWRDWSGGHRLVEIQEGYHSAGGVWSKDHNCTATGVTRRVRRVISSEECSLVVKVRRRVKDI